MTISDLHRAAVTVEMVWELKFQIIPHPAYSEDLALSDHHIFQPPEDATWTQIYKWWRGRRCRAYVALRAK